MAGDDDAVERAPAALPREDLEIRLDGRTAVVGRLGVQVEVENHSSRSLPRPEERHGHVVVDVDEGHLDRHPDLHLVGRHSTTFVSICTPSSRVT